MRQRLMRCCVKATASMRSKATAEGLSSLRFDSSITTSASFRSSAGSNSGCAMASAWISMPRAKFSLGITTS